MWFHTDAQMMSPTPPTDLVIGIDFGTTHSGVAWATGDRPESIQVISNWIDPSSANRTSHKVPTAVTYEKSHPHALVSWGFNAIRRSYHEENEEGPFTWFKLLLQRPENPESKENSELKTLEHLMKKFGKSVQDITVDFLRCLWDYTKKQLQFILGEDFMHRFSVRVILTIPAVWKPATIIMMKDLAKKAGLPENTDLLPEPEAAAIAVLGRAARRALLQAEDVITVCDAGGGTCDLITYEILSLNPLRVKESVTGEGGFCGSVYLDKDFEAFIRNMVGPEQYDKLKEGDKKYMMGMFELGVKPSFQYDNKENGRLIVDLRGVQDDAKKGIVNDTIKLKQHLEELKALFETACKKIEVLVENQLRCVPEDVKNKAILLVGGFGQSTYLFQHLEKKFRKAARGKSTIILRDEEAWSAVVRGATMWGLEKNHMIESRKARYNYGIAKTPEYDPHEGGRRSSRTDSILGLHESTSIKWLLRKGDEIMDGRKVKIEEQRIVHTGLLDFGSRRFLDWFLYCDADKPPEYCTGEVQPLGYLPWEVDIKRIRWHEKRIKGDAPSETSSTKESSLPALPGMGKRYREFKYTVELKLGPAIMELGSVYRGKRAGMVEMPYLSEGGEFEFKWVRPKSSFVRRMTNSWAQIG
ncbi:hypothetical protein BZA77DRAFT_311532 [Pyronema omphalodes]|nr:hypothetical protein BZA77DRAFT_311532 [Pyronema omphalodes]